MALSGPASAEAQGAVTVPANVGVGPAGMMAFGPVARDQLVHPALKIWIGAVIDQETIQDNIDRIDPRYRRQASQMRELRIGAHILIPDSLVVSPRFAGTGVVGATWRPVSMGMPLARTDGFRAGLSAGLILTYAFIWSDTLVCPAGEVVRFTNFLRPGLDLKAEAEFRLSSSLYLSLGWASMLHLPQELGPNPFQVRQEMIDELPESLSRTIWHIGQPFLMLHYRFPFTVRM